MQHTEYKYEPAVAPLTLICQMQEIIDNLQLELVVSEKVNLFLLGQLKEYPELNHYKATDFISAENAVDFLPFHEG